jgi:hypothetical protein
VAVKSTIQATLRQLFSIVIDDFNYVVQTSTPEHLRNSLLSRAGVSIDAAQLVSVYREKVAGKQAYIVLLDLIQNLAFTILMFD